MAYEKLTGTFESSNGTDNCAYYIYVPVLPMNVGYKGIIQISHGMCEYIERYEHFADFLTSHGYIVCGNDHLGHGNSVRSNDDLGFFRRKGRLEPPCKRSAPYDDDNEKEVPCTAVYSYRSQYGQLCCKAVSHTLS